MPPLPANRIVLDSSALSATRCLCRCVCRIANSDNNIPNACNLRTNATMIGKLNTSAPNHNTVFPPPIHRGTRPNNDTSACARNSAPKGNAAINATLIAN